MVDPNLQQQRINDDEELRMFEQFVESPIWKLLREKWKPLVDTATGAALSANVADRGYAAGRASGLYHFLNYPEKHLQALRRKIRDRDKQTI